jgi:hypothetical protein
MTAQQAHATISRRDAVRLLAAASLSSGVLIGTSTFEVGAGIQASDTVDQKGLPDMTQDLAKFVPEHFEPLIGDEDRRLPGHAAGRASPREGGIAFSRAVCARLRAAS